MTKTQSNTHKPTAYADLMKSARQESAWAKTAKNEARDEAHRAVMYQARGYPILANELKWDSKVADEFAKIRVDRAKMYKDMAKKVK